MCGRDLDTAPQSFFSSGFCFSAEETDGADWAFIIFTDLDAEEP